MAQGSAPDNHHQQKKLQLNNDGQSNSSGSGSGSGSGNSGSSSPSANASTGLKKGPWTAAEDAVLIEYVKKHGEGNWNAVQRNAGLARCGKSCRLRWTNHLRPNLKKGSFTPEEERMIIKLHAQLGNKWARMAAQLPGRTDNEIKNYWNTRIKRRIRQGLPLYPQDVTSQPRASSAPSTLPGESPPSSTNTHLQRQAAISTHLIPNGPTNQTLSPTLNAMLLPPPYSHQHHYLKPCFNNSLFDPSSSLSSPKSTAFTTSNSKPFLRCSSLMFNPSHNETTNFSLSSPPVSVMSSIPSSQPLIPSQLPNTTSTFQFNPLSCSLNPADNLQSQPDSDQYFSCISIHSTKPELPSSQFYLCQIEKSGEKPVLGRSNSMLLLDDLLEDAQAAASSENPQSPTLMNLQEEKLDVSVKAGCSWDATSSVITPAGNLNHHHSDINGHEDFHLPPVQDVAGADNETTQEMQRLQKDLLKILNVVPGFLKRVKDEAGLKKKTKTSDDCMQDDVPKLLNAGGDTPAVTNESKGEYLNGQLSAYASAGGGDTMKGFEMEQQVASLFSIETPDFGQTPDSCSWDNLPGMC